METLLSMSGILGAACCVGMYAAVSWGRVSSDKPVFFIVNGLGAVLVLIGASHQFDVGDTGAVRPRTDLGGHKLRGRGMRLDARRWFAQVD